MSSFGCENTSEKSWIESKAPPSKLRLKCQNISFYTEQLKLIYFTTRPDDVTPTVMKYIVKMLLTE